MIVGENNDNIRPGWWRFFLLFGETVSSRQKKATTEQTLFFLIITNFMDQGRLSRIKEQN